jgi:hypothetical protein
LGLWKVVEYERSTGRVKVWRFQDFNDAEKFRRERDSLYREVGVGADRELSEALPEISKSEVDLFMKIVDSPELLDQVKRNFNL